MSPLWLTLWLYAPALGLPFFWDDVIHLRYVSQASSAQVLTQTELVAYYRPLVNWVLQRSLSEGQPPNRLFWHALLIANHLVNGALVGRLAWRLGWSGRGQVAAMGVFATFPFSYQVVLWVLAWFHPLVTTLILGACLGGLRYWRTPTTWSGLCWAWACGMVAPFVHENGVLAGPLVVLLLAWRFSPPTVWRSYRRLAWLVAPMLLAAGVYALMLWHLGVVGDDAAAPGQRDGLFALAYFSQGLSWPLPVALNALSQPSLVAIVALAALTLAVMLIMGGRRAWLGLLWAGLASAPAILLLTEAYLTNAPRLLYLAAVGVALLVGSWASLRRLSWLGLVWTMLFILPALLFVRARVTEHAHLGSAYQGLFEQLDSHDPAQAILVLNAPKWNEPEGGLRLPLGNSGPIMLPDYYALRDLVWANTGRDFPALDAAIFYDTVDPLAGYTSGFSGVLLVDRGNLHTYLRRYQSLYAFQVEDGQSVARLVGESSAPQETYVAEFGSGLRLQVYHAQPDSNGRWQIALTWQKTSAQPFPYIIFSHLLCGDLLLDQLDSAPIDNLYDLDVWALGETWTEYRYLRGHAQPAECLHLRVGLYDRATGQRAPALDAAGQPLPDDMLLLELRQ
jgi:hypothetical protein